MFIRTGSKYTICFSDLYGFVPVSYTHLVPKKQKLKQDADKAAEKSQHLRFGKAEITPDEASRMTKQQKRCLLYTSPQLCG